MSLGIDVVVLGNFTLQRALNWSWNGALSAYTTTVSMAGAIDIALLQQDHQQQLTASRRRAPSAAHVLDRLQPLVNGSLDVLSAILPGPGFSGNYSWRGSLLLTPNPFAMWQSSLMTGSNSSSISAAAQQRRRKHLRRYLAQAAAGSDVSPSSSLLAPVEGPVAVQEWGVAPTASPADGETVTSTGGSPTGNIYLDPDGSVQVVGQLPPSALGADQQLSCTATACYVTKASSVGKAPVITAKAAAKPTSRRDLLLIIIASAIGWPAGIGLCILLISAAAMRRRAAAAAVAGALTAPVVGAGAAAAAPMLAGWSQSGSGSGAKRPHRAGEGEESAGTESSALSFVYAVAPGAARSGFRAGGAAPSAGTRISGFGGGSTSGGGARISAILGTLGFGWRRTGTLPGALSASTAGASRGAGYATDDIAALGGGSTSGSGASAYTLGGDARRAQARRRSRVRSIDLGPGVTLRDVWAGSSGSAVGVDGAAAAAAAAAGAGSLVPAVAAGVQQQRIGRMQRSDDEDDNQKPPGASPPASAASSSSRFNFLSRLMAGRAADVGGATAAAVPITASAIAAAERMAAVNPLFDPDGAGSGGGRQQQGSGWVDYEADEGPSLEVVEDAGEGEFFTWGATASGGGGGGGGGRGGPRAGPAARARLSAS